jgi:hypothetical protein
MWLKNSLALTQGIITIRMTTKCRSGDDSVNSKNFVTDSSHNPHLIVMRRRHASHRWQAKTFPSK